MKGKRSLVFYLAIIAVFGTAIYTVLLQGKILQQSSDKHARVAASRPSLDTSFHSFKQAFSGNLTHPLAILILQIIAIVLVARLFGFLFNKIGQPTVIGEIVAGIVLGPSVVGIFLPEVSHFLFPAPSLPNLQFLSQVGLILFMFVIGMELDLDVMKKQAHGAIVISHASIIIPYTMGMVLAYFLYTRFAPANISFISFALFMGIAMSITAFPVLARIIQERGLTKSPLGILAITCAAADDITAWCLLAVVIAIVKAGALVSALFTISLAIAYVFLMLLVVKPFLERLGNIYANREMVSKPVMAIVFIVLLLSSYCTEIIGIHALFGAFLAGVVMPSNLKFRRILVDKVEDVSVVLLLPLFFVFTGLRTQIGLLTEGHLWLTCGWVILVAVAGKFGGSTLAARVVGQSWKDSLSIGALMNTRGLMELIVLNIGYDLGILSPQVFAMMVLMALLTTFMTGPALDFINWLMPDKNAADAGKRKKTYRLLLSFGSAQTGGKMLALANQMFGREILNNNLTAINLTYNADITPLQIQEFEKKSFKEINAEAERLNIRIETRYKPVKDIQRAILRITNKEAYDFLLVDAGKSLFKGTFIGNILEATKLLYPENLFETLVGNKKLLPQLMPVDDMMDEKAKRFIEDAQCGVGVFIDRDFKNAQRLLVLLLEDEDQHLLGYSQQFEEHYQSQVVTSTVADKEQLSAFDLLLISNKSWGKAVYKKCPWLEHIPSTLIIKHADQNGFL
ncbi:MAG: cation:proton antiporter [Chitinophagaceae bacterium]|nr:cation:proton antiporter [Chitinophagaceae bacterium]